MPCLSPRRLRAQAQHLQICMVLGCHLWGPARSVRLPPAPRCDRVHRIKPPSVARSSGGLALGTSGPGAMSRTAIDSARGRRRNETRALSLMPAPRVNSGTERRTVDRRRSSEVMRARALGDALPEFSLILNIARGVSPTDAHDCEVEGCEANVPPPKLGTTTRRLISPSVKALRNRS
jgi:hypothetical protein